jgi:CRISPR-associated endonuclease Cas1
MLRQLPIRRNVGARIAHRAPGKGAPTADEPAQTPLQVRNGILVLDGYGLRVSVERKHLAVADGICEERRAGRFSKATSSLKRLVVLGHTGSITFEALRWLKDVGAGFVQIDADGQLIAASGPPGLDDARLRRAQALAPSNGVGMTVAREVVRRKLEGQLALLVQLLNGQAPVAVIRQSLNSLGRATTPDQLRLLEATAAAAYWKAWERVPIRFVRRDEPRVPAHWRAFGVRTSPLSRSPRLATNPANAILNYLYAILEGEARIAAAAVGLDPGMGVLHADQQARDSLALDLMEAIRPEVDTYVLGLIGKQPFRAADFFETRQGVCRILPPLTQTLAGTAPEWARRVGPVAEWAAQAFSASSATRSRQLPTPLTQSRRSAGRDRVRRHPRSGSTPPAPTPLNFCLSCGTEICRRRRSYCGDCLPGVREEGLATFQVAGPAALARLMAEGRDPTHGGAAARKRAKSLARRREEAAKWERTNHRPDPEEFRRRILPGLQAVPIEEMARATGLSVRYCSMIRRGLYMPHPRHWEVLKLLGEGMSRVASG